MSLTTVKSFFKTRCDSLNGFKEHKDAFNWHNIGATGFNKAYHVQLGTLSRASVAQPNLLETTTEVNVRLFFKGYRDTSAGVDVAMAEAEKLVKACLKLSNRLGSTIKNITFNTMTLEPFDETNDDAILTTLNFTALVLTDVEGA